MDHQRQQAGAGSDIGNSWWRGQPNSFRSMRSNMFTCPGTEQTSIGGYFHGCLLLPNSELLERKIGIGINSLPGGFGTGAQIERSELFVEVFVIPCNGDHGRIIGTVG